MTQVEDLINNSVSLLTSYKDLVKVADMYSRTDPERGEIEVDSLKQNIGCSVPRDTVSEERVRERLVSETPDHRSFLFVDLFCGKGYRFPKFIGERKNFSKIICYDRFNAESGDMVNGKLREGSVVPLFEDAKQMAVDIGHGNLEFRCQSINANSDLGINTGLYGSKLFTGFRTAFCEEDFFRLAVKYDADAILNVPSFSQLFGHAKRSSDFMSDYMKVNHAKGGDLLGFVKKQCSLGQEWGGEDYKITDDILASDVGRQLVILDKAKFLEEKGYSVKVFNFVDSEFGKTEPHTYNRMVYAYKKDNILKL